LNFRRFNLLSVTIELFIFPGYLGEAIVGAAIDAPVGSARLAAAPLIAVTVMAGPGSNLDRVFVQHDMI
jgi:hypothetical protein